MRPGLISRPGWLGRPVNRQQYVRIKGLSLRAAGRTDGARELLERAADFADGSFGQTVSAWETLADMAVDRGDRETAERLYRRILKEQPSLDSTSWAVEMSLAEILLDTGRPDALNEAFALLSAWIERDGMKLDHQLFRWHLDFIRAAQAMGAHQTVIKRAASVALELAARGPQLPRHPGVGLVLTDNATLQRLRELAS